MTIEPEIIEGVPSVRICGSLYARSAVIWTMHETDRKGVGYVVGPLSAETEGEGCVTYGLGDDLSKKEAKLLVDEHNQWLASLPEKKKDTIAQTIQRHFCRRAIANLRAQLQVEEEILEKIEAKLGHLVNELQTSPIPEHRKITP